MYNDTTTIKYCHSTEVSIKFGNLQAVMDWCDLNCVGSWWFQDPEWHKSDAMWKFSFEDERDLLLFVLTWR